MMSDQYCKICNRWHGGSFGECQGNQKSPTSSAQSMRAESERRAQLAIRECEKALEATKAERHRLLVLATKYCPTDHHDWQEILQIATKQEGE